MSAATVTKALAGRASWSVAAVFGVVGLVLSAWFTQIPQFKAALSLSDAALCWGPRRSAGSPRESA